MDQFIRSNLTFGCLSVQLSVALVGICCFVFLGVPSPAIAVPGETVAQPIFIPRVSTTGVTTDPAAKARQFETTSSGYVGFADTRLFKRFPTYRVLVQRNTAKLRSFGPNGEIDQRFGASTIGRGVKIGRRYEVFDPQKLIRVSEDVYLAWYTTQGLALESNISWPRSTLVAFNPKTGSLVKRFGIKGTMTYGHTGRWKGPATRSLARSATLLSDGRVLTCGQSVYRSKNVFSEVPFVVSATVRSKRYRPFFASGRGELLFSRSQRKRLWSRGCEALGEIAGGMVALSGIQAPVKNFRDYRLWVSIWQRNGKPVPGFGKRGIAVPSVSASGSVLRSMRPQKVLSGPGGSVYVTGTAGAEGNRGFVLRLRPDGLLDSSFATGGVFWVKEFNLDDVSVTASGRLQLSGRTADDRPAAGWLDASGSWDPNFFGTGWHAYGEAFSVGLFYQFGLGSTTKLASWMVTPPCNCQPASIVELETALELDSSVASTTRTAPDAVVVSGLSASAGQLDRVEVGYSLDGSQPTNWTAATGLHTWSATLTSLPPGMPIHVFSRAVDQTGQVENQFSVADKNTVLVPG